MDGEKILIKLEDVLFKIYFVTFPFSGFPKFNLFSASKFIIQAILTQWFLRCSTQF